MPRRTRTPSRFHGGKSKVAHKLSSEAEAWARGTLRKMTLDEKLGQMLMIPCYGGFLPTESPELHELVRQVEQNHAGGLMIATHAGALGIERSQAYATAALVNQLQNRAKIPLLVAGDFERGTAMRIEEGTSFPHAMAVAATGREEDAYALGRITALEARAMGVPWVFAPVADVNSDPCNPIINVRSFGEDPKRVAALVAAYVRGVEENGALATTKHFPGHGDTGTDSHLDLPTVKSDFAHLDSVELVPFRAAIAAGVSTIMTGHLAVPALEPDPNVPATLSEKITTGLLRRKMGFRGLVVTDALDMGGVTVRYSPAEVAVRSALAGSDVLLLPPSPDAALAGLREAVASGRLPISRIDDAVMRILRAKARLGLPNRGSARVRLEDLSSIVRPPEHEATALDIADRGVTLLRDASRLLPLDATRPMRVLLVAIAGDADRAPGQAFERELGWRMDSLQTLRCDTRFATVAALKMPPADTYDVSVVALFVRVADRKGSVGLPDEQVAAVRALLTSEKPTIIVCFGSPYVIARFPEAKTWLAAFGTADVAQRAAARALFGQVATGGRIPVNVPGAVALGAGIDIASNPMTLVPDGAAMDAQLAPAYRWLDSAVANRDFPGGTLAVGYDNRFVKHAFGKLSYEAKAAPAKPDTIYDTASLTKPVVTTTLATILAEAGQIDVDAPIARYLPEWVSGAHSAWRASITIRHLLTHTSGLPAHREYFKTLKSRRAIIAAALQEPLTYEPGSQSLYSDVGFIALGEIIERVTGQKIDQLARELIFARLGLADTTFNPTKSLLARVAMVSDEIPRGKPLRRGTVHDDNARAMGGVAPHAGMFSTAGDLAVFCQMLLNGGIYAHPGSGCRLRIVANRRPKHRHTGSG